MYPPKHSKVQSCAYYCNKNSLVALNTLYIFLSLILIGVAIYARATAVVTNLPILGGVIACGVFLLLLSIFGMVGAVRHSQVILFFYMVILVLLFIIQMAVSIGALAVTHDQQEKLMEAGWKKLPSEIKGKIQTQKDCCGFKNITDIQSCQKVKCCKNKLEKCNECQTCYTKLEVVIDHLLKLAGGVGLFFSFTLLAGFFLTRKLRNRKRHVI
ncbi:tetraspanin-31-A-like isoform X2 [Actinia tenebrosa]|uniref:Tetraspanin-31-A-like isoform X2 n=1 Tax=Actinia tenebrosa TaxID=6105 RepID=A0A6P8HYW1_ACTTE|nr:tetraspanin-31-A-like isoform X2 [Actinia tenebrosa]